MLIRFNVQNYLSFSCREDNRSEEFSMIAGKVRSKKDHVFDDNKIKLLKFAAIYGANASGKSNLVKAMDFMKQTIINRLPEGHTEKYCKNNSENKEKESYFEVEIRLGNKYYAYGFEVVLSQSKFISEWLIELGADNRNKTLFIRDIKNGTYEFGGDLKSKELIERLNIHAEEIQDDDSVLFLTVMNKNKKTLYRKYKRASVLQDVFLWVRDSLDINYPDMPISGYSYLADVKKVAEVTEIISALGVGITNFKMVEVPIEKIAGRLPKKVSMRLMEELDKRLAEKRADDKITQIGLFMRSRQEFFVLEIDEEENFICKTIEFSHGKDNILFHLDEESDGTVRLLDLAEILIAGEGKTYVIDELDRCLHPSLTYKFVENFFKVAAEKNIQLIVTTHESRLLDFDLLRRDEVWFVDKNRAGNTNIYSLEEYNTRFDQKIDKAYLEGRYGGVPIFSTVFPIKGENG